MAYALRFRIGACLAVVAMLFASLAPALAHAGRAPARSLSDICTAFGLERIALDADGSSPSQPGNQQSADCPFCLLHATVGPPPALTVTAGSERTDEHAPGILHSPPPTPHRAAHRSRGPPLAS